MPEGDTVWRTATRLNVALAGEPLEMLQLRWGDLGGQQLLPASTVSVTSRGKHLLHRLDNGVTVHSHLRTDGKWRLEATPAVDPSALANPHLRAVAATRTWTALGLHLGAVDIWPTSQEDAHLGHLGPDLLGDDWNLEQALNNLAQPRPDDGTGPGGTGLAAALLDQRNLAGIGPYWASEGLFLNHVDPWASTQNLPRETIEAVVTTIRLHMRQSITATGRNSGRRGPGGGAHVFGRAGRNCRVCGTVIRLAPLGPGPNELRVFYCASCQPAPAAMDQLTLAPVKQRRSARRSRPKWATAQREPTASNVSASQ